MITKMTDEDYVANIKSVFAELKSSERFDTIIDKSIKLENGNGYLVCISELHLNDVETIEMLARWRREAKTFHNKFDVTFESTKKWLRNLLLDVPDRILFMVLNRFGHPIGHLGFASSFNFDRIMELDNVVRGVQGEDKGIMSLATLALLKWASQKFRPEGFCLRTLDNNTHALNFYSGLGFQEYYKQPLKRIGTDEEFNHIPIDNVENFTPDRYFVCMKIESF